MVDAATSESPKRQTNGFLVTITAILALLTKRASRVTGKPKKLLSNISGKALFGQNNEKKKKRVAEEWGKDGLWQKEILMGVKCEPLDYSGVIYYDGNGKQMNGPLRSPRASPLPGYLARATPQRIQ
ncbi:hypothetical protein RJT34_32644 [Clitoria ternatea]|uniref:Uncharacterized protein n=1 Tax=Clitoria ternatea TaxID=43366 RepID=A0AAN9I2I2_CLITE